MATEGNGRRISVSQDFVERRLSELELRIVKEIQAVKTSILSEADVRSLARQEIGAQIQTAWNVRNASAAVAMLVVAVSTFFLTLLR